MPRSIVLASLALAASGFHATLSRSSSSLAGAASLRPAGMLRAQQRRVAEPAMMAKKVTKIIKLALDAGKANPAPPVGPALGAAGVNIMMFCKEYNARTQDKAGHRHPRRDLGVRGPLVHLHPEDAARRRAAQKGGEGVEGLGTPAVRSKKGDLSYSFVGEITTAQVEEIAKIKLPDLNTNKLQSAMNTVKGTAKNMGIKVVDDDDKYWEN